MKEVVKLALVVVVLLGIVAGLLRIFFMDEIVVGDDRMAPTILAGERVLLWRHAKPELGDIVVCANPSVAGQYVMGRVIGLAGSEITADRGILRVNGRSHDRNWAGEVRYPDLTAGGPIDVRWGYRVTYADEHEFMVKRSFVMTVRPTRVAAGRAYLLSDYESAVGTDSRAYGTVDLSTCLGQVFMRLAPAESPGVEGPPFDHGYLDILH